MWSLTRAHSRKRPALVATTFLNSRGGRLRELRLYFPCRILQNRGQQVNSNTVVFMIVPDADNKVRPVFPSFRFWFDMFFSFLLPFYHDFVFLSILRSLCLGIQRHWRSVKHVWCTIHGPKIRPTWSLRRLQKFQTWRDVHDVSSKVTRTWKINTLLGLLTLSSTTRFQYLHNKQNKHNKMLKQKIIINSKKGIIIIIIIIIIIVSK